MAAAQLLAAFMRQNTPWVEALYFALDFVVSPRFMQGSTNKVSFMATQTFAVQHHQHESLAAERRLKVLSYVGWGYLAVLTVLIAFVAITG